MVEINRDLYDDSRPPRSSELQQIAAWVAVAREQAVRRELAIRRELGADQARAPDPSQPFKEIGAGADVAELLIEQEREAVALDPPSADERERVDPTLTVDRTRSELGERHAQLLSGRMAPLAAWVREQPGWWIRERYAELGPADPSQSRGTAREAARLEAIYAAEAEQRDAALAEAVRWGTADPDRAAVARDSVDVYERRLHATEEQLFALTERDDHPARWASSPDTLRAAVYHDELEVRRHGEIASEVERSLAHPPAQLQERIGPAPGPEASERMAFDWQTVARDLEEHRLARESAEREGVEPPAPRSAAEEQELQARIDSLREQQGMDVESLAAQHEPRVIEREGVGMG